MKRIFKKTTRSREKQEKQIEKRKEEDFLYGRRNNNNNNNNNNSNNHPPPPPPQQQEYDAPSPRGDEYNNNNSNSNNSNSNSSNSRRAHNNNSATARADRRKYAQSMMATPASRPMPNLAEATRGSSSSRFDGGAGAREDNRRSRDHHRVGGGGGGGGGGADNDNRSQYTAPPKLHSKNYPTKPSPHPPPPQTSSSSSGGAMSQAERDRLTKQVLSEERRKQQQHGGERPRKPSFDDQRDNRIRPQSTFEDRVREGYGHSSFEDDAAATPAPAQDEGRMSSPNRRHHHRHGRNESSDAQAQRRRNNREQAEKDRKIKERAREQTWSNDLRSRAVEASSEARGDNAEGDAERRRRLRQKEQAENDRKIKERVRNEKIKERTRDQAVGIIKEPKSSAAGSDASSATGSTRQQGGSEDEAERRRELEQRRRRQREQAEADRKTKERVKQEQQAARDRRSSGDADAPEPGRQDKGSSGGVDESFEQRRVRRHEKAKPALSNRQVSATAEEYDSFEASLQIAPLRGRLQQGRDAFRPNGDEDEDDVSQRVIDMHIEQLRASSAATDLGTLAEFEREEERKNRQRRQSRRVSATTVKIEAFNQKLALGMAIKLAEKTREQEWFSSFYRSDPRWQIMKFFDEVARDGGKATMDENLGMGILASLFNKASVFTVWRPTSLDSIRNMMLGVATGKGLDIKGKSAKKGNISSYVPFIQIYEEAHRDQVRAFIKDGKIVRVFYKNDDARFLAYELINDIRDYMLFAAQDAMRVLSDPYATPAEQELAMKNLMYDDVSLKVDYVDTYVDSSSPVYGLDITERLFWESYVMHQYIDRPKGTEWDIGRGSEPAYMDMNFKSIRHIPEPGSGIPRAVVYQMDEESPMDPRKLLLAYEEHGGVKPVVSDFDCFLLGSRGVKYKNPLPKDQIELVKWSVKNISETLDERSAKNDTTSGWTESWFKVLKKAALTGYYPKQPQYGNGDPKSYEIVSCAVARLHSTGCVRHGAECFNWWFPQEIDPEFLVISDTLPGNLKWKYVKVPELQEILIQKIAEGFTFPINPKWVLCDPGWRRVYDTLLASQKPNVQDSINCWLPPETGLREQIDSISARHPRGFEGVWSPPIKGEMNRFQMEEVLERIHKVQRAWRKLRLVLYWIRFVREKRREREEKEAADGYSF